MAWYLKNLPEISIENFANIKEVRNSKLDWGEFEGEKKYLLAIAEVLGERWEYAKSLLLQSKLNDFDEQGYTFLWFKRYMPEVFSLNPWIAKDLLETIKQHSEDEKFVSLNWYNLLPFNISLDVDDGIGSAIANLGHNSSMVRLLVQKALFWCYDERDIYSTELVESLNHSLEHSHLCYYEYELLILLYKNIWLRPRIEEIILNEVSISTSKVDEELRNFFKGKSNKLRRANPILTNMNSVMGQVISVFMDVAVKFATFDVHQRVLFDNSFLTHGFRIRIEEDVMTKNFYQLERTGNGVIKLSGTNY